MAIVYFLDGEYVRLSAYVGKEKIFLDKTPQCGTLRQ